MKKLPLGIQTFEKIIEGEYIYIDKSNIALDLIENNKYVFLSRPRRFGKSLFLDTLHNIFEGNQELFKGLAIYDKWDWETKYPVIKISFSGGVHNKEDLDRFLFSTINIIKKDLEIECASIDDMNLCFGELIRNAYEKHNKQVVILIDEYDKPILDNLSDTKEAIILRDRLRDFYTKIKDNDKYIRFAFLTGVSKFSKTSVFSGLNNITDISLNPKYGNICGYTQKDIDTTIKPYLDGVDMEKLKLWYNGYNFLGDKVYNPYGILQFIHNDNIFRNYWFESGTPTFLINLVKNNNYFLPNFEDLEKEENFINSFDIEELSLETIMFQAGYLTIDKVIQKRNKIKYKLVFPNIEVKLSFFDYLLNKFAANTKKISIADDLYDIFESGNLNELENIIKRLFASIAYNNFTNNDIEKYEGFYASVLYAYFASLGVDIIAEDVTNYGRIDLTIIFNNRTYIFEFKTTKDDPLKQIKEKRYFEKYTSTTLSNQSLVESEFKPEVPALSEVEVYIIGIVFDPKERNVSDFEWEKI